jgi:Fe-S oxidoreductase
MGEIERVIAECTDCGACVTECDFLTSLNKSPRELAEGFKRSDFGDGCRLPYSCSLCGLCYELCPEGLDLGAMCLEGRQVILTSGREIPPSLKPVFEDRDWVATKFSLVMPATDSHTTCRVFFPGCNLCGYSPSLVMDIHSYLRSRLPDTGVILGCCGHPTLCTGDAGTFERGIARIESNLKSLGAVEGVIAACPQCHRVFKEAAAFPVVSLYEVIAKQGIPSRMKETKGKFSLHDSCPARYETSLQDSVRDIMRQLGVQVFEMKFSREKTRCCGMGGMVGRADFKLANRMTKRRVVEANPDIISYCASCRENFAFFGKPSLHLLDLVFSQDWEQGRRRPARTRKELRENQVLTKSQFRELFKTGER